MTDHDAYRDQFRRHIAAIDGRRPQNGHSDRGFSTCPHPDCIRAHDRNVQDTYSSILEQRRLLAEQIARLDKSRERMATYQRSQLISRVYRTHDTYREMLCIVKIYDTDDGIVIEVR